MMRAHASTPTSLIHPSCLVKRIPAHLPKASLCMIALMTSARAPADSPCASAMPPSGPTREDVMRKSRIAGARPSTCRPVAPVFSVPEQRYRAKSVFL